MKLINVSKRTILALDLKKVISFSDRSLGLLKKSNPRSLLFQTRFGIHTIFLKEPIDVVILDSKFQVVLIKECIKPNSLLFWNPKYSRVIELPKGIIKKTSTKAGDILLIKKL